RKLLLILFLACPGPIFAQDLIVKMDSTKISAKVLTVTEETISYKRWANPDGPTYVISRNDVARIEYSDGTVERFGISTKERMKALDKNVISITMSDIVVGLITVSYERMLVPEFSLRLTGSTGIAHLSKGSPEPVGGYRYYNKHKIFSVGLEALYLVYRGKKMSYQVGVLAEVGSVNYGNGWYGPTPPQQRREYYAAGITNGISLHVSQHFDIALTGAVGWCRDEVYYDPELTGRLGFSVGYRF
ncbi:MAG TPA: hypothetical protein VK826_19920, partial [Bacteroidia bacterium]|nr:hypothetical protein [Bacteroidia bacterium]